MRMRKKKWADPYLEAHNDFIYEDPSIYKGKWKELFGNKELHVEIGMGKGDYINGMAKLYPDTAWVGIEKDRSAAAVAARKALEEENAQLENKRMIVGDAEHICQWFGESEVDVIHLNFSDPWPKKHYHKRRLSSKQFLESYHYILSDEGKIIMKTDNQGLFEDSIIYLLHNDFMIEEISVDYRRIVHNEDVITEYESRFMDKNQPIYRLVACRVIRDKI